MAQVKLYGLRRALQGKQGALSDAVHACAVEVLGLSKDKCFHRFFLLDDENFLFPPDRSEHYLVLEFSMFEGRTPETKRRLISLLYVRLNDEFGIHPHDLEITIFETPRANWGIRGVSADQLALPYEVNV